MSVSVMVYRVKCLWKVNKDALKWSMLLRDPIIFDVRAKIEFLVEIFSWSQCRHQFNVRTFSLYKQILFYQLFKERFGFLDLLASCNNRWLISAKLAPLQFYVKELGVTRLQCLVWKDNYNFFIFNDSSCCCLLFDIKKRLYK